MFSIELRLLIVFNRIVIHLWYLLIVFNRIVFNRIEIYLWYLPIVFNRIVIYLCYWKRCFLKTSVSNGIIYTKYTQNPHIIEPPFNIATQSANYTVTACVSRWEPNVLNANNPCPAARQKQYWYFISLLRFSALKCKPNSQKNVVVLENLIIESLHMIETEL